MTPIAQVGHVLMKDLREHRVRVAAFVVIVAIACARAAGAPVPAAGNLLSVLTVLTGIAIVGAPVLAESPADPRAPWGALPIAPGAVLAAKLAFLVLLVVLAGVGQSVAIATFDLPLAEAWPQVIGPVLYFAGGLLAFVVVAAATTDARTHLLLVLALVIGLTVLGELIVSWGGRPRWMPEAATIVVPLLMVGALAFMYRTRRPGLAPIAVAFGVVLLGAFAIVDNPASWATNALATASASAPIPRATLRLVVPEDAGAVSGRQVRLRIVGAQPEAGWQYGIRQPDILVTLRSGRTIRLFGDRNLVNLGGDPGPFGSADPSPVAGTPGAAITDTQELSLPFPREVAGADGDSIVRVRLTGNVVVTASRAADTLPLVVGVAHTRRGIRSTIDTLDLRGGLPTIRLRAEGFIQGSDEPLRFPFRSDFGRTYQLVGSDWRTVVPLNQGWRGSGTGGLVLPTTGLSEVAVRLDAPPVPPGAPAHPRMRRVVDEEWLRGARLVAIDATLKGSYPVVLEWKRGG